MRKTYGHSPSDLGVVIFVVLDWKRQNSAPRRILVNGSSLSARARLRSTSETPEMHFQAMDQHRWMTEKVEYALTDVGARKRHSRGNGDIPHSEAISPPFRARNIHRE